jgi:PAS domain S-box-containing protein
MSSGEHRILNAERCGTPESSPEAVNALHTFEMMDEAAVLTRLDGSIFRVTPAFDRLVEFSTSELSQISADDFLADLLKDSSASRSQRNLLEDGLKNRDREVGAANVFRVLKRDGAAQWMQPTISNVTDGNGVPVGKLLVLRDVTEMYQARLTAEESRQKYRELVELMNSAVLRVNLNFTIQFVNEYANRCRVARKVSEGVR